MPQNTLEDLDEWFNRAKMKPQSLGKKKANLARTALFWPPRLLQDRKCNSLFCKDRQKQRRKDRSELAERTGRAWQHTVLCWSKLMPALSSISSESCAYISVLRIQPMRKENVQLTYLTSKWKLNCQVQIPGGLFPYWSANVMPSWMIFNLKRWFVF